MLADDAIAEVVRRLAGALRPDRIVLFGSRARGDADPDSDYDLAVIMDSDLPWYRRESEAYRALRGLGIPVEVIVLTPDELSAQRQVPGSLYWALELEGKVLYDAGAS